jgi:beta-galactosidase
MCVFAAPCLSADTIRPSRQELSLISGWRFHLRDQPGAETEAFDDSSWTAVRLPHTRNAQDGQDGGNNYFRGTSWYRRHFSAPLSWVNRQVYVQFEGVNRRADVYLNGQLLGTHLGGFARFRFDVTRVLKLGATNVLAVKVNNEGNNIIPTAAADFTFFGGIYRGVSLLITNKLQIETLDYGSSGVYVKQEHVSPELADLAVTVKLANHER